MNQKGGTMRALRPRHDGTVAAALFLGFVALMVAATLLA
jgi:hypothetical protein